MLALANERNGVGLAVCATHVLLAGVRSAQSFGAHSPRVGARHVANVNVVGSSPITRFAELW